MAQIIPFRIRADRPQQRSADGQDAQVILFTGVRYERTDTDDEGSEPGPGPIETGRRRRG